jgi:hypothetical protein
MTTSLPRSYSTELRAPIAYTHVFVDTLPDVLENNVVYVCMRYATAAHNCFCGCGREVVTPIHPTKWQLAFDGVHISLFPSVGSWSLPCRSHYWVRQGRVSWADTWSQDRIDIARADDLAAQETYWSETPTAAPKAEEVPAPPKPWWQKLFQWMGAT